MSIMELEDLEYPIVVFKKNRNQDAYQGPMIYVPDFNHFMQVININNVKIEAKILLKMLIEQCVGKGLDIPTPTALPFIISEFKNTETILEPFTVSY